MRNIQILALLFITGFWALAPSAFAKDYQAKSENFILVGDVKKGDAVSLLQSLEAYRHSFFSLFKGNPGPEKKPIRIYVAKDHKQIEKLTGASSSAGVYKITREGPVFVLSSRSGFKKDKRASKIAFHEYTHHMVANFTSRGYPTWFNEGFAEYYATFEMTKNDFTIGVPDKDHAYILSSKNWFPMEALIGSVRGYPFVNINSRKAQFSRSLFYAQSWLAVHYIQSHPGYIQKFQNYLNRVNRGENSLTAFEASFGMTADEFGQILRAYYKSNRYKKVRYKLVKRPKDFEVGITELLKDDLDIHFAEARKAFRG